MTHYEIIQKVVDIILKHAKPTRIYLYGSRANGEAESASDIDIAYDDDNFTDYSMIEEEVAGLKTLIKIDVKNIAHAEARFKNRVISSGRVVYSSDKKLRAEDGLWNLSKALKRFADVVDRKDDFFAEGFSDIYPDLMIKRFEFTYEMSWKALKRYLAYVGIKATNPRICFQEAYAQGVITDERIWLDMMDARNVSSHTYDENEISDILAKMPEFNSAFAELKKSLEEKLS